ncbi:hypothetical protein B4120_4738 [Bacillus cereus]|nr:hypothetical protein B4120_4738 [Bacillus cereus]
MKYIIESPKTGGIKPAGDTSNICPTCGEYCIGTIQSKIGVFFTKTKRKRTYSCLKCSTKWHTGWQEVN